jgi:hypothetical protein
LLDESVPRALGRELEGHDWSTVPRMGWSGRVNGVLLGLAVAAGFEVLLTCDRNMQHQQNLSAIGLALMVIAVPDTKIETLRPLVLRFWPRSTAVLSPVHSPWSVLGAFESSIPLLE